MDARRDHDPLLFGGVAEFYKFRPPYPVELLDHIEEQYALDGRGVALDLGCGTGDSSLPLADCFSKLICVDPDPKMLRLAMVKAREKRARNVTFVQRTAADFLQSTDEVYKLVIMGESFHWMDQVATLDALYKRFDHGGAVLIFSKQIKGPKGYKEAVDSVIESYLGKRRRAGQGFFTHPRLRHEEVVRASEFSRMSQWEHCERIYRTPEEIVGFLYSTSYANRRLLGERLQDFERDMKTKLLPFCGSGRILLEVTTRTIEAVKEG